MRIRWSKRSRLITLICSVHKKRNTFKFIAYFFNWHTSFRRVVFVSSWQVHFNDCLVICGYHVKLAVPSSLWFSDSLLSVFFKTPCPLGCTLQEVLSNANTSTFIDNILSCCKAVKIRCITPFDTQRLKRLYILFHLPYSFGSALHLHPFSAIYNIAFMKS